MNDFDFENLQKKRLARNAKYKKNGSKSRKCTMPSDHLTPAQKRALNGEVQTYSLGRPMRWSEFKTMPDNLKKEYIVSLQQRFGVTDRCLAEMFGVSKAPVAKLRAELNIPTLYSHKGERMSKEQTKAWAEWSGALRVEEPIHATTEDIGQTPDRAETTPAIVEKPDEPEPEKKPKEPNAMIVGGQFRLSGTAGAMAEQIAYLFANDPRRGSFVLTFEFEGGKQA